MENYPEAVAKIAADYLSRVKSHLRVLPLQEQDEFLRELQSHIYEAYQQTPGDDEVARILAVLRKLGEPADVVSDRLPGALVRSGTKRNLPLFIAGGILVALFGLPLGAGGVGVLVGLLAALAGIVVAYYAVAGSVLLVGTLTLLLGLMRLGWPQLFDRLVTLGFIQLNGPPNEFFERMTSAEQGLVMILFASVFIAAGLGLLWLGRYLLRGLRFLLNIAFDWMRRSAQLVRRKLRQEKTEAPVSPVAAASRTV